MKRLWVDFTMLSCPLPSGQQEATILLIWRFGWEYLCHLAQRAHAYVRKRWQSYCQAGKARAQFLLLYDFETQTSLCLCLRLLRTDSPSPLPAAA